MPEAANGGEVRAKVEAFVNERMGHIQDAVEIFTGDREANPMEVLPVPTEVRDDAEGLPVPEERVDELYEVVGRLGIGSEVDVVSSAEHHILEGGKPWKIESEAEIAKHAKSVLFAASPFRIIGQDEAEYMQSKHSVDLAGKSEYDVARVLAQVQEGFMPLEQDEVLPFGYDINNNHAFVAEPTGQVVIIGEVRGKPVMLLRVDRENYEDEEGKPKYRNQPDSSALMIFVGDILTESGDETASVALDTSTTYASRVVDTMRAGLKSGRVFEVGMYGRQTIADVRSQPVAEPTHINQIPGELRTYYDKLAALQAELNG